MLISLLTMLAGMIVVFVITVVTGYFVAQEFAYMAVDRSRLTARSGEGDEGARRALKVTRRTSFMLSGAQLGITLTGLLVGYVAEPLIGQSLSQILGVTGIPLAVSLTIGAVIALTFSTIVQMVFGELFPKNLAIAKSEVVALRLARSTIVYLTLFGWLIVVFDKASNLLLRAVKIEPVHDVEHAASDRDLEHIVAESRESGDLPAELSMMIDRIIDFPRRTVAHAMIPRSRVDTVNDTDAIRTICELMTTGHSRYPVLAPDEETVTGVIHLADVLATGCGGGGVVSQLKRTALFIPTFMALPDALARLNSSGNQLACVLDEYGSFAGLLTLEDLAEELVGEISDEHDPETVESGGSADDGWELRGDIHVDEAERALGIDLPRGPYETIAGLVIAHCGRLPEPGTVVEIPLPPDPEDLLISRTAGDRYISAEVLEVARHVPALVRITLPKSDSRSARTSAAEEPG